MKQNSFPYSNWVKILGAILVIAGIIGFLLQYHKNGIFDWNELAVGSSWGLVFIFFSKEKTHDEMIQQLKYKSLAIAIIAGFSITQLYDYLFVNPGIPTENSFIHPVSAYQFLALTLMIAITSFYYLKYKATLNAEH